MNDDTQEYPPLAWWHANDLPHWYVVQWNAAATAHEEVTTHSEADGS